MKTENSRLYTDSKADTKTLEAEISSLKGDLKKKEADLQDERSKSLKLINSLDALQPVLNRLAAPSISASPSTTESYHSYDRRPAHLSQHQPTVTQSQVGDIINRVAAAIQPQPAAQQYQPAQFMQPLPMTYLPGRY